MSRNEIVTAYLEGGMSRRMFVRRLVAAGVSVGAAVSYAHLLEPQLAHASAGDTRADFYTPAAIDVVLKSKDIDKVVDSGKLRVQLTVDEACNGILEVLLERQQPLLLGNAQFHFSGPGTTLVRVALTKQGREALEDRNRAKVRLFALTVDQQGATAFDELRKKLK
jgi:hypothetical protein